jgi:hypothetical protein
VAIVGASLSVFLAMLNLISRFNPSLVKMIYGTFGVAISSISLLVSISYLIFFITLSSKQK